MLQDEAVCRGCFTLRNLHNVPNDEISCHNLRRLAISPDDTGRGFTEGLELILPINLRILPPIFKAEGGEVEERDDNEHTETFMISASSWVDAAKEKKHAAKD